MKNIRSITLFTLTILFCTACDSSDTNTAASVNQELLGKIVSEKKDVVKTSNNSVDSTDTTASTEATDSDGNIDNNHVFDSLKSVKANDKDNAKMASDAKVNAEGYTELSWEDLRSPQNNSEAIIAKYEPLIDKLTDDQFEAEELYAKMEEEFKQSPPNASIANKKVAIPGFIAPLEQNNGLISEFLLVPYFGACMHMPAPPSNQVVHVKVGPEHNIRVEDAYDPIWVSGEVLIDSKVTDIGSADYKIHDAKISSYE